MTTSAPLFHADRLPSILGIDETTIDYAVGHCGNVTLYVWRRVTRPALCEAVERALAQAEALGGGQAGIYGYIEPETILPDVQHRARLAEVMQSRGTALVASAVVFEGDGFRAAAVRSVATGLALLARHSFPHRVFATTPEATRWLVGELDQRGALAPDPSALNDALHALRRAPAAR